MPGRGHYHAVEMFLNAGLRVAGVADVVLPGITRPEDVAMEGTPVIDGDRGQPLGFNPVGDGTPRELGNDKAPG